MRLHSAALGGRSPGPCVAVISSARSAAAPSSSANRSSCWHTVADKIVLCVDMS